MTNVAPGPMDTPFFNPAEIEDSIAHHKSGQTIFANAGYTTR